MLFEGEIQDWDSWGKVYQSIPLFLPVIQEIFRREGLRLFRFVVARQVPMRCFWQGNWW